MSVSQAFLWLADLYRHLLALVFSILGPRFAYPFCRVIGGTLYDLLPPLRSVSEQNIRVALCRDGASPAAVSLSGASGSATAQGASAAEFSPPWNASIVARDRFVAAIARRAFVHRIWDIADLLLAERWLSRPAPRRNAARIAPQLVAAVENAKRERRPIIFVTGYFGPFDLLPILLGGLNVGAAVLYKPHANAAFDRLRRRVRALSGCELVTTDAALSRLPQVLSGGGRIGLVADHEATRRGVATTFLGVPTLAPRTVGLLAAQYDAVVIVAAIRRAARPYTFELLEAATIHPNDWAASEDAPSVITRWYLAAIERVIRRDPAQYHWARMRAAMPAMKNVRLPASMRK